MSTNALSSSNLDTAQRAFCVDATRALRLLAPAGSGKTYSLLWRCLAHLQRASEAKEAVRFLIFTFTRVARDELRDRLYSNPSFAPLQDCVDVNTLNGWSFRWLKSRLHNPRLVTSNKERGFLLTNTLQPIWQKHPAIRELLTDSRRKYRAQRALMDQLDFLKGLGFRHDMHDSPDAFRDHLKWLINAGMKNHVIALVDSMHDMEILARNSPPDAIAQQIYEHFMCFWRDAVLHLYESAILSFEDQKYWTLVEMEKALADGKYTTGIARYHHIFVDEFQDINVLDLRLLDTIAKINKTQLCIVGDDDQAIYEWRGASPDFILSPDRFISSDYKTHILDVNYRCPRNVVTLSQKLIQHNKRRVPKQVTAASRRNAKIEVLASPSVDVSADYVLATVRGLVADDSIGSIAIVSRKRSQLIPYQIIFAGDDIPFYAAEDLNVLLSHAFDELKQLLLLNAQSTQPLPFGPDPIEALLSLCDKVKRYPLKKDDRAAVKKHLLSTRPKTLVAALDAFYDYDGPLKGENAGGAMTGEFYHAIRGFLQAETVAEAIQALSLGFDGLQKDYGKSLDDVFYADPPFLYLSAYAQRYGNDYAAFYEDVDKAIATLAAAPSDNGADDGTQDWKRKLHLMTALRAKGKEFDLVIILDCNKDIWPSKLAQSEEQMEGERRLFYVAFTRAKQRIMMLVNESILGELVVPSPYLAEMGLDITAEIS
jgi:DNA helicase II / ATP-dependent DNA helicase PcrA